MASGSSSVNGNIELTQDNYHHVRSKYRELMDGVQQIADDADSGDFNMESLKTSVLEANDNFTKVKRPREAVLDGKLLKLVSSLAKSHIESAQSNLVEFRPTEFAAKLKQFMMVNSEEVEESSEECIWTRFGGRVSSLFKRTSGIEPMYAALELSQPPTVRQRAAHKTDSHPTELKKPQQIESTDEEGQTEEVNRIFKILKRRVKENGGFPVCYFTFVTNPQSFGQTVENMFYVSFLIRDQHVTIIEDENGLPVIGPHNRPSSSSGANKEMQDSKQWICSINTSEWEEIVEVFGLSEPMIPVAVRPTKRPTE